MNYYIFKGRFQPFHYGHLQVVKRTLEILNSDDIFVLATMCSFNMEVKLVDEKFAEIAAEHRLPERNPWGSIKALEAINEVSKYFSDIQCIPILTTLLPYPNLAWPVIKDWFPKNRVWIIPEGDEKFDDSKAEFYSAQHETVIRVKDDSGISGRILREYFYLNDQKNFCKGIPSFLHKIYWNKKLED